MIILNKKITILILVIILFVNSYATAEDLDLSGSSYVLMDEISGRVLLEKNAHTRLPMASTTKIMTALIAIENGNLDEKVIIDEDSINVEGSSIYLKSDEVLKLEDLLYGLMLRSGNDSAVAISKHIGENEEKFIKMMNDKAKSINAKNTSFRNPHGLSQEEHYSTSYDLALITRNALANKNFQNIFSSKSYTAKREKNNYFVNKNKTLWEYEGGDGGKTGYTMEAGRCLVSSATKNSMRLIAVSLNARDWFNDNYKLFDYGFENFKPYFVYNKNQLVKQIELPNSKKDLYIVTEDELFYPLTLEEKEKIQLKINLNDKLDLPISQGDKLGILEVFLDGILIRKENLVAKNNVKKKSILDKMIDKLDIMDN